MIFDSHAHLIADDLERYPVSPLTGKLRPGDLDDPVTAERLLRLMDEEGVERALVVQRAHIYGYDNSYVVDSAAKYPDRLAAIVAINAQDQQAPENIGYWTKERGAKGIRLAATKMEAGETDWLTPENGAAVWQAAAELGTSICVHVFRPQRAAILIVLQGLVARFPAVPVVIDHFSNMAIEGPAPDYGLDPLLASFAVHPEVTVKFSTINLARLAESGQPAAPVITRVIQEFGARRVMWGSDIGQSKPSYAQMTIMARQAVEKLDPATRQELLYAAAARVYG